MTIFLACPTTSPVRAAAACGSRWSRPGTGCWTGSEPPPPWLRKLLWRLPTRLLTTPGRTTWVLCTGEDGRILHDLQADDVDFHMVTGVAEHDGRLYLGSLERSGILALDLP